MYDYDICIIGAGASGMAAAITALETDPQLKIVFLEKNDMPGRKIRATGNGRCNLSNTACENYLETLKFFDKLGIFTRTDDTGRIYPYTEDASDVVEFMFSRCLKLGAEFIIGARVYSIKKEDEGDFTCAYIAGKSGNVSQRVSAKKILIASGGKAGPQFGTSGDGYTLARELGHRVTRLAPALTGVETYEDTKDLSGIRAKVGLTLKEDGREVMRNSGEIQFTDYGVSGICVFDLSRYMVIPEGMGLVGGLDDYSIEIDFLPGIDNLGDILRRAKQNPGISGEDILRSYVRKPLAKRIVKDSGGELGKLAIMLKRFILHPKKLRGWEHAQVTKGGIEWDDIDRETLESKVEPGIYFAGEILDFDGACGGFNLQNAWETGIRAGKSIASK